MRIDPKDLRRHYESLSDEGFLDSTAPTSLEWRRGSTTRRSRAEAWITRRNRKWKPSTAPYRSSRWAQTVISRANSVPMTQAHRPLGWKTPPAPSPPTFTQMAIIWSPVGDAGALKSESVSHQGKFASQIIFSWVRNF
jgi:hypothetical protein